MTNPGVLDQAGSDMPKTSKTSETGPDTGLKIHWNSIAPTTSAIREDEKAELYKYVSLSSLRRYLQMQVHMEEENSIIPV